ncbi:MAG: type II secretion system F family protein [Candidatus Saccharimonadales bacterium]
MQTYTYTARDVKTGDNVSAEVQADSEAAAAKLLVSRGLAPLNIKVKEPPTSFASFRNRIPTKEKVVFSRQLSTLINSGVPLVQSLNTVRGQTGNAALKEITGQIIADVEAGSTLAKAMSKHPKVFDNVYVSLIAAGETSGNLDVSLDRLANQQEKDAEIVSKVRGALVYPLMVLFVLFGVLVFMLIAVLPPIQSIYEQLPGARLPLITRGLLSISNFIISVWWLVLLVVTIGGTVLYRWTRSNSGKEVVDELKLRLWPVRNLFSKLYMARFSRTAATLVGSGVPIIKMLDTTAQAVGNIQIARSITKAAEQVKGGKALSESLRGDPNFPDLVPSMINVGEQSGALDDMMSKVADYYEKEVDNQIKTISTVIEPVLMIIVGILALIIVASVLLPVYTLAGRTFI